MVATVAPWRCMPVPRHSLFQEEPLKIYGFILTLGHIVCHFKLFYYCLVASLFQNTLMFLCECKLICVWRIFLPLEIDCFFYEYNYCVDWVLFSKKDTKVTKLSNYVTHFFLWLLQLITTVHTFIWKEFSQENICFDYILNGRAWVFFWCWNKTMTNFVSKLRYVN